MTTPYVAISKILRDCGSVLTIGPRASLSDYDSSELRLIRSAELALYPGPRLVETLEHAGIPVYPNSITYRVHRCRETRLSLMKFNHIPHQKSRVYYGRQKRRILSEFQYPFTISGKVDLPRSEYIVHNADEMENAVSRYHCVVVQQLATFEKQLRLIFICSRLSGALLISADGIPASVSLPNPDMGRVLTCSLHLVSEGKLDEIAIDWAFKDQSWKVTRISRPPLRWQTQVGIADRRQIICCALSQGTLMTQSIHSVEHLENS